MQYTYLSYEIPLDMYPHCSETQVGIGQALYIATINKNQHEHSMRESSEEADSTATSTITGIASM